MAVVVLNVHVIRGSPRIRKILPLLFGEEYHLFLQKIYGLSGAQHISRWEGGGYYYVGYVCCSGSIGQLFKDAVVEVVILVNFISNGILIGVVVRTKIIRYISWSMKMFNSQKIRRISWFG